MASPLESGLSLATFVTNGTNRNEPHNLWGKFRESHVASAWFLGHLAVEKPGVCKESNYPETHMLSRPYGSAPATQRNWTSNSQIASHVNEPFWTSSSVELSDHSSHWESLSKNCPAEPFSSSAIKWSKGQFCVFKEIQNAHYNIKGSDKFCSTET